MGNKNQTRSELNWQSANPAPFIANTPLTGNVNGAMASTNVIYSQIVDVTIKDNHGLELTWTGTPTGTIEIQGSVSGINFYDLTFDPVLTQPTGSAGGYLIDLNQFPFKYLLVKYTNASGTGTLNVWLQQKDLN